MVREADGVEAERQQRLARNAHVARVVGRGVAARALLRRAQLLRCSPPVVVTCHQRGVNKLEQVVAVAEDNGPAAPVPEARAGRRRHPQPRALHLEVSARVLVVVAVDGGGGVGVQHLEPLAGLDHMRCPGKARFLPGRTRMHVDLCMRLCMHLCVRVRLRVRRCVHMRTRVRVRVVCKRQRTLLRTRRRERQACERVALVDGVAARHVPKAVDLERVGGARPARPTGWQRTLQQPSQRHRAAQRPRGRVERPHGRAARRGLQLRREMLDEDHVHLRPAPLPRGLGRRRVAIRPAQVVPQRRRAERQGAGRVGHGDPRGVRGALLGRAVAPDAADADGAREARAAAAQHAAAVACEEAGAALLHPHVRPVLPALVGVLAVVVSHRAVARCAVAILLKEPQRVRARDRPGRWRVAPSEDAQRDAAGKHRGKKQRGVQTSRKQPSASAALASVGGFITAPRS